MIRYKWGGVGRQQGATKFCLAMLFLPLVSMAAFFFYPIYKTVELSFYDWNGMAVQAPIAMGWENYLAILDDPVIPLALGNNLKVFLQGAIVQLALSFELVWVMTLRTGGPLNSAQTLVSWMYTHMSDLNLGYAAALSVVIFALTLVGTIAAYAPVYYKTKEDWPGTRREGDLSRRFRQGFMGVGFAGVAGARVLRVALFLQREGGILPVRLVATAGRVPLWQLRHGLCQDPLF